MAIALQGFIDVASHMVVTSTNLNSLGRTSLVHRFNESYLGTEEPEMSWYNQKPSLIYSRGGIVLTSTQINHTWQRYWYLHKCHHSFRTSKSWTNRLLPKEALSAFHGCVLDCREDIWQIICKVSRGNLNRIPIFRWTLNVCQWHHKLKERSSVAKNGKPTSDY